MSAMSWLQSLDVALFRFINETLSNPLFDRVMPFFSGNSLFVPLLFALAAVVVWRAGIRRGRGGVLVVVGGFPGGPPRLHTLQHPAGRPRPFHANPPSSPPRG